MATIETQVYARCYFCGKDLDTYTYSDDTIEVKPCSECMESHRMEGYEEGFNDCANKVEE